jgi:hypothetical protein
LGFTALRVEACGFHSCALDEGAFFFDAIGAVVEEVLEV